MTENIYDESLSRMNSYYDITNFRYKYNIDGDIYDSPLIDVLNENYEYILMNSNRIELEEKYKYKPYSLSKKLYGNYSFWFIIMYMNGCFAMEDFDLPSVIVPRRNVITYLVRNQKSKEPIKV